MMGNVQLEHRIVDGVEVYRLPPHAPDVLARFVSARRSMHMPSVKPVLIPLSP